MFLHPESLQGADLQWPDHPKAAAFFAVMTDDILVTQCLLLVITFHDNFFFFFDYVVACGILVSTPEIEPVTPEVEMQSLNHWIIGEVCMTNLVHCAGKALIPKSGKDSVDRPFDVLRIFVWSLVAQMVKNLPAMQETQVQSLCQEDPLEKGMATHSNILAWRIPWTEEPSRLQSMALQRVGQDQATNTFTFSLYVFFGLDPVDRLKFSGLLVLLVYYDPVDVFPCCF